MPLDQYGRSINSLQQTQAQARATPPPIIVEEAAVQPVQRGGGIPPVIIMLFLLGLFLLAFQGPWVVNAFAVPVVAGR